MKRIFLLFLLFWWGQVAAQDPTSFPFFHSSLQANEPASMDDLNYRSIRSDRSMLHFNLGAFQSLRGNGVQGLAVGMGIYVSHREVYGKLNVELMEEWGQSKERPIEKFTVINITAGRDWQLEGVQLDLGAGLGYLGGVKRGEPIQPEEGTVLYDPDQQGLHEAVDVRTIDLPLEAMLIYRAGQRCDIGLGTTLHLNLAYPYLEFKLFLGIGG